MELHWHVNEVATVLHIAAAVGRGLPLADPRLAVPLQIPVGAINDEFARANQSSDEVWSALCSTACQHENVRDAVGAVLAVFPDAVAAPTHHAESKHEPARQEHLVALLTEVEASIRGLFPRLGDELRHRSRPLRELWEARGPGLMYSLGRSTEPRLTLAQASVFVVHPVLGGGGGVDPTCQAVRIEALLANTVPGLPEVVRLGWFLSQLACHQAAHQSATRLPQVPHTLIELAMVPATLAAAETVELARCDLDSVKAALIAWRPATPDGKERRGCDSEAEQAWQWWTTRDPASPWGETLGALADRL